MLWYRILITALLATATGLDQPSSSAETTDLASVLEAANELLLEWRASKAPKQNWGQRSTILNESWVSLRETLMNTTVSGYAVNETSCMKCSEHVAVVRCYDCHIHTRLCGHCHQLIHEMQPFHDRDGSTGGFWKPIPPIVSLDCDGQWISVDRLLPSSHASLVCPTCNSESAKNMKPALSVMHAKAHSWSCQVIWGGRWQNGASATTGEEVEQINSHFSRLGISTKHMLPEGREELLTENALQWNRKKVERLPQILAKRYSKTKMQLSNAEKDLSEQLEGLHVSADVLTCWKEDLYHAAQSKIFGGAK
ncbi:uncharacterized protein LOC144659183 [Oculina patagonica]